MTIPSEQLGWSNESKLLRDILKKLERLGIIISSGSSQLTSDELAAIQGANSPDAGNPFATMDDISDCCVVVSQTEPTNPSDGLLWYKPDLCLTTTTTTLAPPQCPEGAVYSGWLTVGVDDVFYGYVNYDNKIYGSINPSIDMCIEAQESSIAWNSEDDMLFVVSDLLINCGSVTLIIDGETFVLIQHQEYSCAWYKDGVAENPFAPVGELSSICILCGAETTPTTTLPPK